MDIQLDTDKLYLEIFRLSDPFNNRAIRLDLLSNFVKDSTSESYAEKNYIFGIQMGKVSYDIAWTNAKPRVCISSYLMEILFRNKINGWKVHPMELHDPKNIITKEFFVWEIAGPNYVLDKTRMQLILKEPIVEGGKPYYVYKGFYFNDSEYSGEDIFLISNFIFISKKLKIILENEKIRNIKITPILDVEIDKRALDRG